MRTFEIYFSNFLDSSIGKESAYNAGDPGSIPGSGRSAGEGNGNPLQYSWASLVAQLVQNPPQCGRPGFDLWVGKIPWRRERLPSSVFWPGELHGLYIAYEVAKSQTRLRHFHFNSVFPFMAGLFSLVQCLQGFAAGVRISFLINSE